MEKYRELNQPEFDFAGKSLETIWNRQIQEQSANWTEEALCLQWLCPKSCPDWDWWHGLHSYERNAWMADYRCGRDLVEQGLRMPSPMMFYAKREELWKETKAIAKSWSHDIRQAFKDGKSCPIKPAPMFTVALDMAIDLAGISAACLK